MLKKLERKIWIIEDKPSLMMVAMATQENKMSRDYKALFAKIEAAEPFEVGAKVYHNDDVGTDAEGTVYTIAVCQGIGDRIWLNPSRPSGSPHSYEKLTMFERAVSSYNKLIETFEKLDLADNVAVNLIYEDNEDVVHYTGEAEETAVNQTTTVEKLVELARSGINFEDDLISDMRDADHLEEYERGSYDFEAYCSDTLSENFYDYDNYIECNTEHYDHKRGNTTVTAKLRTTVQDIKSSENAATYFLDGWKAEFETSIGTVTVEM